MDVRKLNVLNILQPIDFALDILIKNALPFLIHFRQCYLPGWHRNIHILVAMFEIELEISSINLTLPIVLCFR